MFTSVWFISRTITLKKSYTLCNIISKPKLYLRPEEYWIIIIGTISGLPYFLCGWFWYLSIPHTSVTANTAIYDSAFVFVFIFSMFLLKEKISLLKIISVIVSFAGLMLIAYTGSKSEENGVDQTPMGYVLVVLSTVLYAAYEVIYKKWCSKPDNFMKKDEITIKFLVSIINIIIDI